ncbi:MAG: hypothetical protein WCH44_15950, partial [Betaproteobacteria bacterium]
MSLHFLLHFTMGTPCGSADNVPAAGAWNIQAHEANSSKPARANRHPSLAGYLTDPYCCAKTMLRRPAKISARQPPEILMPCAWWAVPDDGAPVDPAPNHWLDLTLA